MPRYRPRFSLRVLLAFPVLVGAAVVAWRQHPFSVESTMLPRERVEVYRDWDGRLYHWGKATQFYEGGQKAAEITVYGPEYDPTDLNQIGAPGTRYWHADGTELDAAEWYRFYCSEYLPRFSELRVSEVECSCDGIEIPAQARQEVDWGPGPKQPPGIPVDAYRAIQIACPDVLLGRHLRPAGSAFLDAVYVLRCTPEHP